MGGTVGMINSFSVTKETSPNGKERLRGYFLDSLTGKKKSVTVTVKGTKKTDLKKALKKLESKISERMETVLSTDNVRTLEDLNNAYIADMEQNTSLEPATVRKDSISVRTLAEIIGKDVLIKQLPNAHILEKLNRTGESAERRNGRLKVLKRVVRWGYRNGYIQDISFLDRLEPFKCAPHRESIQDKYLEQDEYNAVLDAMTVEGHKLLMEFLVLSGCRTGEALALEKADIDFEGKTICISKSYNSNQDVVSHAKTKSSIRFIHIQPQLSDCLHRVVTYFKCSEIKNGIRSDLLFHDEAGEHYSYYAFRKHFGSVTEKTIGRRLSPHSLRHTHASFLFERGFTYDEVADRLGHHDSKITKAIDVHITKKLQAERNSKLDSFRIS